MREPLSKKTRFEVFKRNSFKCCYCGQCAPNVILEADHINPVANGGDNSIINLITACKDCNRGKGARTINDNTAFAKQKKQLDELQERKEQIELMQQWREELKNLDDDTIDFYEGVIIDCSQKTSLSDFGRKKLLELIKKYRSDELIDAIETSFFQYFRICKKDTDTSKLFNKAFNFIPKIIECKRKEIENPNIRNIHYCKGILKKRLRYCDGVKAFSYLKSLFDAGYDFDEIKYMCGATNSWTQFVNNVDRMLKIN